MTLPPSVTAFLTRLPRFRYGDRSMPARDWFVVLMGTIILILISIAWNAWFFFGAIREQPQSAAPETSFDLGPIQAAQEAFDVHAGEEAKYRNDYRFNDPAK